MGVVNTISLLGFILICALMFLLHQETKESPDEGLGDSLSRTMSSDEPQKGLTVERNIIVTNPSMDSTTEDVGKENGEVPPGLSVDASEYN